MASECYMRFMRCLRAEVSRKQPMFSWLSVAQSIITDREKRFYFLWRLAEYLHTHPMLLGRWYGDRIVNRLFYRYGCDIELGTQIVPGLRIRHFSVIVIDKYAHIGAHYTLSQNTTIGAASPYNRAITLEDHVSVGANACIIGDNLHTGNNVTIGAAAFINKNLPDNSVLFTASPDHPRKNKKKRRYKQ